MKVRAARGAIVVVRDDAEVVLSATERLIAAVLERNAIERDDLISVLFTVTDDLRSAFPAEAARRMGLGGVPLMCAREIPVEGSMPSVIRLLAHFHSERTLDEIVTCTSTARSRYAMTSTAAERIAIVGTGLIGTSIAMASARVGCDVSGWDVDRDSLALAAERGRAPRRPVPRRRRSPGADIVIVCAPVPIDPRARRLGPSRPLRRPSSRTPAASRTTSSARWRTRPVRRPEASSADTRWAVPSAPDPSTRRRRSSTASSGCSHPDDGTEATGSRRSRPGSNGSAGARCGCPPRGTIGLVAFVSHLPQVASTALMGLAATEEADEPDILLLAAGGFRDLTRLASSNPALWSQILLSNREAIAEAIDLYSARLVDLRAMVVEGRGSDVEGTFDDAKQARLRLAAKPQVRAGVAVLQVQAPDRPGALAELTSVLAEHDVNIEDLQIVHSPEGRSGDGASHGRRHHRPTTRSVCSRLGPSTRSAWPEDERCASE